MRVSVIIPCYNEADSIAQVIARIEQAQIPEIGEIVVVDDASTDATHQIVEQLITTGATSVPLRVFRHPNNQGKGAAVRTGFAHAQGSVWVIQDADLEYHPRDLNDLLQPLRDGMADVVYGSRFVGSKYHRTQYFSHYLGNRSLTLLSNIVTGLNLTDVYTGYKAFRREVLDGVNLRENDYGFEQEFTCKVARRGYRIYEVGVSYAGRTYAEGKKIRWHDGVRGLRNVVLYGLLRR